MRWSVDYKYESFTINHTPQDVLKDPESVQKNGLSLGPDGKGRKAKLGIYLDDLCLNICVLAESPVEANRPNHPEWYYRRHVVFFFNPGHDHKVRRMYAIDDRGECQSEHSLSKQGEEVGDLSRGKFPSETQAEMSFEELDEKRYLVKLRVPLTELSFSKESPLGFRVKVGFHEAEQASSLQWPKPVDWAPDQPMAFGKLYMESSSLKLERLRMDRPFWGGEASEMELNFKVQGEDFKKGYVMARTVLPGDLSEDGVKVNLHQEGEGIYVKVPVAFPYRAKWASEGADIARLELEARDEEEKLLWKCSYPFSFDSGIIIRERFGASQGKVSPRPEPSDKNFDEAFRRYILTRLPDYQGKTTQDGAPSDFYLEDPEGKASLDLMSPDVFKKVAFMLTERFSDWQDALCAASMWVSHPCISRHSGTWSRVGSTTKIENLPRVGGYFCGDTTRVLSRLVGYIGERLNVPLKGLSMGMRGHITSLVESPGGRVVIDGMSGLWYFTMDNTRLATLEEMREDNRLAKRMWHSTRAHGHEYFYGVNNQIIRGIEEGVLEHPDHVLL